MPATKRLFSLKLNGKTILSVSAENDDWLPVAQKVNPTMLRHLTASALRNGAPARTPTVISGFGNQRAMQLHHQSKKW